jgi:hypothetical protein
MDEIDPYGSLIKIEKKLFFSSFVLLKNRVTFSYSFISSIFQKFLQLEKYSRWKIIIQSIFGQLKILYKKIKENLIFEIF